MKPKLVITPTVNKRGRHEAESLVTPHKIEGGKRKGRSMKTKRIRHKNAFVTMENLQTARDNDGIYVPSMNMVIYNRKEV